MVDDEELRRPDPDALLAQVCEKPRGKLKVFFGACAGVGKTYAMLQEAQRLRAQGLDVLVGVVETHGRSETAAQLDGLEVLPQTHSSSRASGSRVCSRSGACPPSCAHPDG